MSSTARAWKSDSPPAPPLGRGGSAGQGARGETLLDEVERLRAENRRLAVSLGGFSAFVASRGLLEDAWQYVHQIHQMEEGSAG